jgi:hypothetical protein
MMMNKIVLILSMLVLPVTLLGQSTLNFPRAYTPADLTATGFAVVNPGPADATVTFRLLSASGATVAVSSQSVRGRGQLARLGSEYFQNAATAGWVQATSATSGLQGFWIGGDFSTYTDGADGAVAATDQILPLVAEQTEINIANPGSSAITVTIRLRGASGVESSAAVTRDIPALGIFQGQVLAIFPGANLAQPTHIRITSPGAFAATSVVTGLLVPRDTGVVNGVDASSATLEMNFPHVVSGPLGGQNYSTVVGVTNLASTAQTATIIFTRQDGGAPTSVQRTMAANGTLRETVQSLFNFIDFQNGWIKVTSTAVITGYVAYAETTAGGFAVVPVQVTPRTSLLFLQVADLPPWSTGISLLNATNAVANVEVFAMYPDPDRGLIGGPSTAATASFTLNPGTKIARLLPELVGMSVNGGFVFVRTTNNVPLYGLELFFDRRGSFLANVTAGSLAPGISFTPPGISVPPGGPVLSALSTARTTRNTTVTLTGSNFSTNASDNLVVFKTVSGTVDVAASTATATSITVVVPSSAVSGPVSVKVNGQPTAAGLVLEITGSATALDQNNVRVSDGQPSSNIDFYVPPPASPLLNATQAGAVNVGSSNFTFTNSADLPRGQTKELAISGTGMTQANGSGISFSGEGLTISNVRYQTNGAATLIIVTITVDANAEVGPRNIGIKNSNLDQTILAGGVFIR